MFNTSNQQNPPYTHKRFRWFIFKDSEDIDWKSFSGGIQYLSLTTIVPKVQGMILHVHTMQSLYILTTPKP